MKRFTVVSIVFCAAAILHGTSAEGAGDEDGQFVKKAAAINLQQTADACATAASTQRSAILNTARFIARDHARAERQLRSLAARKGMTLPDRVATPTDLVATSTDPRDSDPDHIARLLKGGEEAVAVFHQEAVRGVDPDLQHFARTSLTALQQKVTALRSLQEAFPAAPMVAPQSD